MSDLLEMIEISDAAFEEKAPGSSTDTSARTPEPEESPWLFAKIFKKEEFKDVWKVFKYPLEHRPLAPVPIVTVFAAALLSEILFLRELMIRAIQIGAGDKLAYFLTNSSGQNVYKALGIMGFAWSSYIEAALAVIMIQVMVGVIWHWGEEKNHREDVKCAFCVLIDMIPFTLIGIVMAHVSVLMLMFNLLFRTYYLLNMIFRKEPFSSVLRLAAFIFFVMMEICIFLAMFIGMV